MIRRTKTKTGMTGGRPRKKVKTVSKLKKELWELCKQVIRAKHGNTCYTCGATGLEGSNWHTGHFITKSTCSAELAYDLNNLRPQCYRCNVHLSGNWPAFEAHLILDEGRDFPDLLKRRNLETKGKSYGRTWYEQKIAEYREIV